MLIEKKIEVYLLNYFSKSSLLMAKNTKVMFSFKGKYELNVCRGMVFHYSLNI